MIAVEVKNLQKSYGDNHVIEDLSLTVEQGEKVAFSAPSGCGKTTLFRLIASLEKPDHGRVYTSSAVAYLFQEPRLFPGFTVLENVAAVYGGKTENPKEKAAAILEAVGMGEDLHKYPDEISGGMAQRTVLARALAAGCEILLLDEPFKGLDEDSKKDLIDLTKKMTAHKTLLLITHDREEAQALCEKTLHFVSGMKLVDKSAI